MDATWEHFHAVLLKNYHKDMKVPVTTHDLHLLAESKLLYTNIRNSGKRTQTDSRVCVCACVFFFIIILVETDHGEHLSKHHSYSLILRVQFNT